MASSTYWLDVNRPSFPALSAADQYDVVIIGGGITGVTAAYLLQQEGRKVCLVEKGRIGGGETGHTSAHLAAVTDLRPTSLVRNFGESAAALVWQAGAGAIDFIESAVHEYEIRCEFRRIPGFLHAALRKVHDETDSLQDDADAAAKIGADAAFIESVPGIGRPGVAFADQARFQPVRYLHALAQVVHRSGGAVFENSEVTEFNDDEMSVVVNGHAVQCDYVIVATHVPLMGKTGLIDATLFQSKLAPYFTYVVSGTIPRGRFLDALYWDTSDPYYYLRLVPGEEHDRVIFGGLDHKTGQKSDEADRYHDLADLLKSLRPEIEIDQRWSGQVVETNDGLPYIGETAERQFVATGFSGNGLTFGTFAGMLACDAALGRRNPWQDLFSVRRKHLRGGTWDYLKENVDYPFYLIGDWLTRGRRGSVEDLAPGTGEVLLLDGKRVACSRSDDGELSAVSAVCTHMGCLVRWNSAESTWDCPCHGSRFSAQGEVIGGPAETPLEQIEIPDPHAAGHAR